MSRGCKEKNNSVYTLSAYRFEQIINVKLKKGIFCKIIIFYQRLAKIITIFLIWNKPECMKITFELIFILF